MQAGLAHKGKKTYGFQGNGLSAGVGTGDDQQTEILSKPDINGNHSLFIQKRMTAFFDVDASFGLKMGCCVPLYERDSMALAKIKSRSVSSAMSS